MSLALPNSINPSDRLTGRRLERAVAYVSDYWFPVNSTQLSEIKRGLKEGRFEQNLVALHKEIRSDVALFTHCIRKLAELLAGNNTQLNLTPIEILERASYEQLKDILSTPEASISSHSAASGSNLQLARFHETMLSASTAEVLSEGRGIDSDTAFSAAILRQLGLTLIAWNYPGLYEECVFSLGSEETIEQVLERRLGFSPALLALRVVHEWGLSDQVCINLGLMQHKKDEESAQENAVINSIGDKLKQLCEVGEALARAKSPANYPSAKEDWHFAQSMIEAQLGADGLEQIVERFRDSALGYTQLVPEMFQAGLIAKKPVATSSRREIDNALNNPYLAQCTESLKEVLSDIYKRYRGTKISPQGVRELIKKAVPLVGFSGGCIFTIDPSSMVLVPQVELGKMQLRAMRAVDYNLIGSKGDAVAQAFRGQELITEYRSSQSAEPYTAFSGMFGASQKIGVLYLEMPGTVSNEANSQQAIHFNAIRHTLNFCLHL